MCDFATNAERKKKQRGGERKVKVSVKSRGSTKKQTNQEGRVNKLPPSKEIGQAGRKKKDSFTWRISEV